MEKVKTHVEQRVRSHLRKRHKVKDRRIGEGASRLWIGRGVMDSIKFQQQRAGNQRMPGCEEHRKAVCGKTACPV